MTSRERLLSGVEVQMLLFAAVAGALGGLAGVGFRLLVTVLQEATIGPGNLLDAVRALPWWGVLLVPTAGAAVASILLYAIGREKETAGVSDLMEIVSLRKGADLRVRTTVLRVLASLGIQSTGGSVGREGAIVQMGAALSAGTGRAFGQMGQRMGLLLGCGVAAGMASAYNAPVAGAIFAMELILANFAIDIFAPVVVASVSATTVVRVLLPNKPVYEIPGGELVGHLAVEAPAFLLLGVASGAAAWAFVAALTSAEDLFRRVKVPPYVKTTFGGLAIGVMGLWVPHVWGNGYEVVDLILHERLAIGFVAALIFLKILATSVTVGSGGPGGVFTPSLFVGAALGTVFGAGVKVLLPGLTGPLHSYAMVGMAGLIAGTTQAPIMAIFVIVEMTADFGMVVPLMLGSIAAAATAHKLGGDSVYTGKLRRRGVRLPQGIEETALAATRVRDVMRRDPPTVLPGDPFEAVLPRIVATRENAVYVVDAEGRLKGAIRLPDVKQFLAEPSLGQIAVAADLAVDVHAFTPDSTLAEVLPSFDDPDLDEAAVVDGHETRRLIGVVARRDVIAALAIEVLRSSSLRAKFVSREAGSADYVELPRGHRLQRVPAPPSSAGRTIQETNFRQATGLWILTVVRNDGTSRGVRMLPEPSLLLQEEDAFIVIGPDDRIDAYLASLAG